MSRNTSVKFTDIYLFIIRRANSSAYFHSGIKFDTIAYVFIMKLYTNKIFLAFKFPTPMSFVFDGVDEK